MLEAANVPISTRTMLGGSVVAGGFAMRFFASAILLALLPVSTAGATVYVWTDQSGTLVLTNKQSALPDSATASLTIYETSSASEPTQSKGQHETKAVVASEVSRQPGPAGVVASSADGGPRRDQAPPVGGNDGKGRALGALGANPPDAPPHGDANTQAGHSGGNVTDPRALLARAAQREPPQVLVSVVAPSAPPLSTSRRSSSASGGMGVGDGGMSGSSGASVGNVPSSGMLGTR